MEYAKRPNPDSFCLQEVKKMKRYPMTFVKALLYYLFPPSTYIYIYIYHFTDTAGAGETGLQSPGMLNVPFCVRLRD